MTDIEGTPTIFGWWVFSLCSFKVFAVSKSERTRIEYERAITKIQPTYSLSGVHVAAAVTVIVQVFPFRHLVLYFNCNFKVKNIICTVLPTYHPHQQPRESCFNDLRH